MRVGGHQIRNETTPIEQAEKAERSERSASNGVGSSEAESNVGLDVDRVSISASASEASLSLTSSEGDAASRVARIKAEIESDGYPIDYERLAEKIIDDELGRFFL